MNHVALNTAMAQHNSPHPDSVLPSPSPPLSHQLTLTRPSQSSSTVFLPFATTRHTSTMDDHGQGETSDLHLFQVPSTHTPYSYCLPSPPPTNSDPKHPIPLPAIPLFYIPPTPWRVLDSPPVPRISKSQSLCQCTLEQEAPPSPPPTEPLTSAELPPEHEDEGDLFTFAGGPSTQTPSTPLSPISPDLCTRQIQIPTRYYDQLEDGYLLRHSPPFVKLQDNHTHADEDEFFCRDGDTVSPLFTTDLRDNRLLAFSPSDHWPSQLELSDEFTHEDYMDVDMDVHTDSSDSSQDVHELLESPSPPYPSSPLIRNDSSLPSIDDDLDLFDSDAETESDDLMLSPSSPHMRHCFSLPDMEEEELEYPPPSSPSFSISPLTPPTSFPSSEEQEQEYNSLLLDEFDDIPPRSPSPDIFTIDPTLLPSDASADPELTGLCELQRKAQAAEKAARAREASVLEEGIHGHEAAEARRAVKREKRRVREVQDLVRLKMRERERERAIDEVESEEGRSPRKKKKAKMSSVPQLVANMLLSRYEPKPMSGRRPFAQCRGSDSSKPKYRSPLAIPEEAEGEEGDELDQLGLVDFGDFTLGKLDWGMDRDEDEEEGEDKDGEEHTNPETLSPVLETPPLGGGFSVTRESASGSVNPFLSLSLSLSLSGSESESHSSPLPTGVF